MTSPRSSSFHSTRIRFLISILGLFTLLSAPAAFAGQFELDTSFGTEGLVSTNFTGKFDTMVDLALDSNEYIVAVGLTPGDIPETLTPLLTRYKSNGELDDSFGTNGLISTDFGGGTVLKRVATDSAGDIVVGGSGSRDEKQYIVLARYTPSGELDTSFGTNGLISGDFGGDEPSLNSLVLDSDENIVVGGTCSNGEKPYFVLARYTPNGVLDDSFGTNGLVSNDFGGNYSWSTSLALDGNGNIVIGGGYEDSENQRYFALARYTPNGELDASFDTDGLVSTDFGDRAILRDVAVDADGNIVAGGNLYYDGGINAALARYKPNGDLDSSFGTNGLVSTDFADENTLYSLVVDSNGNIVTGGNIFTPDFYRFALARYKPNGELDALFGTNGLISPDFGERAVLKRVAIDSAGDIVVGGSHFDSNWVLSAFALARYTEKSSSGGCNTATFSGAMILLALPLALLFRKTAK